MTAYYNENEPFAAQWLRNLITKGLIAPGDVDERSIADVQPGDLEGYTQCHFFAGLGGWSYAARLAGWPDDKPLWTGSCPCQPFSVAGLGKGETDERHLWPEFFRLIDARRPSIAMGEQVAAAVGRHWLDGVRTDLEGSGYACRSKIIPACAVDAPHRRDRLWFVGHQDNQRGLQSAGFERSQRGWAGDAGPSPLEHPPGERRGEGQPTTTIQRRWAALTGAGLPNGGPLSDTGCEGFQVPQFVRGREPEVLGLRSSEEFGEAVTERGCASGPWAGSDWIVGHDGKARRVKSGIRLLAHGVSGRLVVRRTVEREGATVQEENEYSRVGALKALGNAIVPQVAAELLGSWLDVEREQRSPPSALDGFLTRLSAARSHLSRTLERLV